MAHLCRSILHGHLTPVMCVAVSTEVGVVASADSLGRLLLHSVRDGSLLRSLSSSAT